MAKDRKSRHLRTGTAPVQHLWLESAGGNDTPAPAPADELPADDHSAPSSSSDLGPNPPPSSDVRQRKSLQDLLFKEGMEAAKLSLQAQTLEELQAHLIKQFGQNSVETRLRYAQSVVRWFFHDGIDGLAKSVWRAYADEAIEADILRFLYLTAEPIVGGCVAHALFPLENGMQIPPEYLDRYLRDFLHADPPEKTRMRLKMNLMKLGFLSRGRGKPDRLVPVIADKTSLVVLVHALFAAGGPRTIELRHLLAHPFWKYLGYKSDDAVRTALREADAAKLIGKYVVADQLEQVTTCFTLQELLARKVRL